LSVDVNQEVQGSLPNTNLSEKGEKEEEKVELVINEKQQGTIEEKKRRSKNAQKKKNKSPNVKDTKSSQKPGLNTNNAPPQINVIERRENSPSEVIPINPAGIEELLNKLSKIREKALLIKFDATHKNERRNAHKDFKSEMFELTVLIDISYKSTSSGHLVADCKNVSSQQIRELVACFQAYKNKNSHWIPTLIEVRV
jgi:hypothetical protein